MVRDGLEDLQREESLTMEENDDVSTALIWIVENVIERLTNMFLS